MKLAANMVLNAEQIAGLGIPLLESNSPLTTESAFSHIQRTTGKQPVHLGKSSALVLHLQIPTRFTFIVLWRSPQAEYFLCTVTTLDGSEETAEADA